MITKLISLVVLLCLAVFVICDKRFCSHGRIDPIKPYYLETDDLVLECHSNQHVRKLSFAAGRNYRKFDEKYIVSHNSTYAKFVIPNITESMVKRYKRRKFIACLDADNASLCMDNVYVQLEYYPREVVELDCVFLNFLTLTCSWSLGVNYKYAHDLQVTSNFQFLQSLRQHIHHRNWKSCPDGSETSCYWNADHISNVGLFLKMGIQVKVTNTRQNISADIQKTINRDDIVKPSPVENLNYSLTEDPTCIWLSWQQDWVGRNFIHNISLLSKCGSLQTVQAVCDVSNCTHQLCGLNPFTEYKVNLVTRYFPNGVEKGLWSEAAHLQFTTGKTSPYLSPVLTDGLYKYGPKFLTVYFKPLTDCERQSSDTVYDLVVDQFRKTIPSWEFKTEIKIEDLGAEPDSFVLQITAENQYGLANKSSSIIINRQTDVPTDSELIVEYKREIDGKAPEYIATTIPDDTNDSTYRNLTHTLTWCRTNSIGQCKDYMRWLELGINTSTVKIPVEDASLSYKFGLVTKATRKSTNKMVTTDINFVQCVYGYGLGPHKPLPSVQLPEVISPYSLTVEWDGYVCRQNNFNVPFVENYVLTYCKAEKPDRNTSCLCVEEEYRISVSRQLRRYTVADLEPDTGYCVWVAANNSLGLGPKNSNNIYHVVTDKESYTIILVVSLVCVVFVVGVAVFLLCHFCKQRIQTWYRKLGAMELPDIRKGTTDTNQAKVTVVPHTQDVYLIQDTNIDEVSVGEDSALDVNSATPLMGYHVTRNIECDVQSDNSGETECHVQSNDSESSDLNQHNPGVSEEGCPLEDNAESKDDPEIVTSELFVDGCNNKDVKDCPIEQVDAVEGCKIDDLRGGVNDVFDKRESVNSDKSKFVEGRSEEKLSPVCDTGNCGIQNTLSHKNCESQLNNVTQSSEISTTGDNLVNSNDLTEQNTMTEPCVMPDSRSSGWSENGVIDWGEGNLDGYAEIPQIDSGCSDSESDIGNVHKPDIEGLKPECDTTEIQLLHRDNAPDLAPTLQDRGSNFSHDVAKLESNSDNNDLKSKSPMREHNSHMLSAINSCDDSKTTHSHIDNTEKDKNLHIDNIDTDMDSDFGDSDPNDLDMKLMMKLPDINKRLSVISKESNESVVSVGSDSAIDSMESCHQENESTNAWKHTTQNGNIESGSMNKISNKTTAGTWKHTTQNENSESGSMNKKSNKTSDKTVLDTKIDLSGSTKLKGELSDDLSKELESVVKKEKKSQENMGVTVVVHDKLSDLPEDYSLAEHV